MSNPIPLLEVFASCMEAQTIPAAGSPCHVAVVAALNGSGKKYRLPARGAQAAAVDEMETALRRIIKWAESDALNPAHVADLCNDVLEKFEACKVDLKP